MNKQSQSNYASTLNLFLHDSTEIKNPVIMADILFSLHRCEISLNRYYTIECERGLSESENKRMQSIENKVKVFASKLGFDYRLNSDPRGCAIRFLLPSKKYNSWDGETWSLNW